MISRFLKAIFIIIFIGAVWTFYRAMHIERWIDALLAGKPIGSAPQSPDSAFTPEVLYWWPNIQQWANQFNLDPDLVATVMQVESCGDPNAISSSGAQGLFQVMPFHFTLNAAALDPATNANAGLAFLVEVLNQARGDANLAMAAYNGGAGVIGLQADQWSAETRSYYYWVSGIYSEAKRGSNARLQEWLRAGGSTLCQQADRSLGIKLN
ncbi:MAG TPA: lytic transglycosylase domain-containing protein [Anaerolineae bacterium]|nr:lytic transglycosylase domain-containing protein [Anaerolineae bacterium]